MISEKKLDALDLVINTLLEHEKRLDEITERLERVLNSVVQEDLKEKIAS